MKKRIAWGLTIFVLFAVVISITQIHQFNKSAEGVPIGPLSVKLS